MKDGCYGGAMVMRPVWSNGNIDHSGYLAFHCGGNFNIGCNANTTILPFLILAGKFNPKWPMLKFIHFHMNVSHGRSLSGTGSLVKQNQQQNWENSCKLELCPHYFPTENFSQAMSIQPKQTLPWYSQKHKQFLSYYDPNWFTQWSFRFNITPLSIL